MQTERRIAQLFADEFIAVHNMMQHDDFVRCIISTKNRVPSVVLYTDDDQLRDVREFCFDKTGSVLAFDNTYNLGDIYVTPSVYKNKAMMRQRVKKREEHADEENDDESDDSEIEYYHYTKPRQPDADEPVIH